MPFFFKVIKVFETDEQCSNSEYKLVECLIECFAVFVLAFCVLSSNLDEVIYFLSL